ncbi:MAG: HAMP domain-containing protein, partial [Gammaproteobacteria bacterium]|nr:HAMP domain-containing protein [Gammaproteobacteria bacterium]
MYFPLRLIIPLIIFFLSVLPSAGMMVLSLKEIEKNIEREAQYYLQVRAEKISTGGVYPDLAQLRNRLLMYASDNDSYAGIINNTVVRPSSFLDDSALKKRLLPLLGEDKKDYEHVAKYIMQRREYKETSLFISNSGNYALAIVPVDVSTSIESSRRDLTASLVILAQDIGGIKSTSRDDFISNAFPILLFVLVVSMVIAAGIYLYVSKRIKNIIDTTVRFAEGDLQAKVDTHGGGDELDQLAQAYNDMGRELLASQQQLLESNERIQLLLDSTAESIFGVDEYGVCIFANRTCRQVMQTSELVGQDMWGVILADDPETSSPIKYALNNQSQHAEGYVVPGSGTGIEVEYWAYPIQHDDATVGAVISFIDISNRKRAEKKLKSSQAWLSR